MENKNNNLKEIFDFIKDLVVIIIVVIIIRTFIAEPFQISGESMASSYYDKEFIIVDRFSYLDIPGIKIGEPKRGDVIVFKPGVDEEKEYFIKRIVGLPGDTIKIVGGEVYLKKAGSDKFEKLDEKYLNKENYGNTKVGQSKKEFVFKVPNGKYFVMGDNRNHSSDSRVCFSFSCKATSKDPFISKDQIIGKVFLDLGYFNRRNFSFTYPGNPYPEIKGIDTFPRWLDNPSTFKYE